MGAPLGRLAGRVAVVAGGAGGLGCAVGALFAQEGAGVVLADLDRGKAQQAAERAAEQAASGACRGAAVGAALDVTDPQSWSAAVRVARRRFGAPDILVNSAGVLSLHAVESLPEREWDRVVAVCQRGVWLGIRALLPSMRSRGGGSVVNLGSVFGTAGSPASFAYHAAKGAVRAMTKAAAVQLADQGIRVNSVAPGLVHTAMTGPLPPEFLDRLVADTPLHRPATPEEVARAVLFLASAEASYVTGAELAVDGGFTASGPSRAGSVA